MLALQGDFEKHRKALERLGASCILVKHADELDAIDGLVVPGGESTTFLKLLTPELKQALKSFAQSGSPILCTCAGLIVFASKVSNPEQESLEIFHIEVSRNAYGRQIDSFSDELQLTVEGKKLLQDLAEEPKLKIEGVFIRAPEITDVAASVSVLATHNSKPVLIKQENMIGASFHPELTSETSLIHKLFLEQIEKD